MERESERERQRQTRREKRERCKVKRKRRERERKSKFYHQRLEEAEGIGIARYCTIEQYQKRMLWTCKCIAGLL